MIEPISIGDATLYLGDMRLVLPTLEPASVDSVVTDSPYGLGFMGKDWDHGVPGVHFWREILRVAKPGAYLLAFGGTRTYHRLASAIEDAGWEIRDQIQWLYGSGFPKSLNIVLEYEQELCEYRPGLDGKKRWYYLGEDMEMARVPPFRHPSANEWAGWSTALKPAHEPIVVARKPLEGTVAANVLVHGTGGLNIDGCRVPAAEPVQSAAGMPAFGTGRQDGYVKGTGRVYRGDYSHQRKPLMIQPYIGLTGVKGAFTSDARSVTPPHALGRWPANVCHDGSEEVVEEFDKAGIRASGGFPKKRSPGLAGYHGWPNGNEDVVGFRTSAGSAARFFYCAKANKKDRDEGLDNFPQEPNGPENFNPKSRKGVGDERMPTRRNGHPTVKPTALMRWLVRLVTPPGGIVLDPFMGSGSTGKACAKEGFRFLGIELDAEYFDIACRRIEDAMTGEPLLAEIKA